MDKYKEKPIITDEVARQRRICWGCGFGKEVGMTVCWICFKNHPAGGLKYSEGDFEEWQKEVNEWRRQNRPGA